MRDLEIYPFALNAGRRNRAAREICWRAPLGARARGGVIVVYCARQPTCQLKLRLPQTGALVTNREGYSSFRLELLRFHLQKNRRQKINRRASCTPSLGPAGFPPTIPAVSPTKRERQRAMTSICFSRAFSSVLHPRHATRHVLFGYQPRWSSAGGTLVGVAG